VIYTGSFVFTYPGVDPDAPGGFLVSNTYADFFDQSGEPILVEREQAIAAVRRSLNMKLAFNFNMQVFLISRRLIEQLGPHGDFFQSPFPDYYASCAALLNARGVVADPRNAVVIGVTPKSYGFFHLNKRESEGRAFLSGQSDAPTQLPGTNINEGWLRAMESLEANYGRQFDLRANRRRYQLLQVAYVYAGRFRGNASAADVARLESSLPTAQRLLYRAANQVALALVRVMPSRLWSAVTRRLFRQFPDDPGHRRDESGYQTLLEVTERFSVA
jgi:hypothetical protein